MENLKFKVSTRHGCGEGEICEYDLMRYGKAENSTCFSEETLIRGAVVWKCDSASHVELDEAAARYRDSARALHLLRKEEYLFDMQRTLWHLHFVVQNDHVASP